MVMSKIRNSKYLKYDIILLLGAVATVCVMSPSISHVKYVLNKKHSVDIEVTAFTFISLNNDTTYAVTGYIGTSENISIPNSVTKIANFAFQDCISLTGITLPDTITSIGLYAFWGCSTPAELYDSAECDRDRVFYVFWLHRIGEH